MGCWPLGRLIAFKVSGVLRLVVPRVFRPPPRAVLLTADMSVPARTASLARILMLGLMVFVLHAVLLSWLRNQLPQFEPLAQMADPMFTRRLEASAVAPVVTPPPAPVKAAASNALPNAATAREVVASPPAQAASEPVRLAEPEEPAKPVAPVSESAPVMAPEVAAKPAAETAGQAVPSEKVAEKPAEAAASSGPAVKDDWPAATRLSYKVTGYYRGDLHGTARVQWQREGPPGNSRYQVQLDLHALGIALFTMTSQGEIAAQGLSPRVYEERRPGGVRRVWFEADALKLDDGRRVALPPQAQDTASQFVELGHRFSIGREVLQAGREIGLWLARPGGVDLWTYDVQPEEILQAGELGPIAAHRLKPRPLANPRGNVMAEIWFAPRLQFLPARVRISMGQEYGNEVFVDLMVERIEQAAK